MKKKLPLLLGCMLIVLSGCSRDKYMPNAGATPEVIFNEACAKCWKIAQLNKLLSAVIFFLWQRFQSV